MEEREFMGILGESLTERLVKDKIDIYLKTIRDITIECDSETTQIDNLIITAKGIYVIENKNYNSLVVVNEDKQWFSYYNKTEYHICNPNPVEQNAYHIKLLAKRLNLDESKFKSVIIMGYNTKLDVKSVYHDVVIINIQKFIDYMYDSILNSEDCFTHEDIDNIYLRLKVLNQNPNNLISA